MGGGGGTRPRCYVVCLLAAPIGLSLLLILTLCGPERVLVVSTEPPDDLSCLTTPGVGRPGDGAVARAIDQVHPDAPFQSMPPGGGGLALDGRRHRAEAPNGCNERPCRAINTAVDACGRGGGQCSQVVTRLSTTEA